ncbi:hypothetical protein QJS04_geneDACA017520 [Acorus gramineus]|uniref:NADP-dependent oxidoreductase domain-containing protein n=1 Tax=Acorus gramineus TaxID=55184 RepID=A0AAV9AHG6_ACOGR|nr:hypothetical protein QJS04_geneDACA017520 [Acorus gramineus]
MEIEIRKKKREFCKARGIHVTAYSPLGAKGTPRAMNDVMESDVLKEIANDRGKSDVLSGRASIP